MRTFAAFLLLMVLSPVLLFLALMQVHPLPQDVHE